MQINVLDNTPGLIRVALAGELDTVNVGKVEIKLTAMLAGTGQDVVVDISSVSIITSLGIGLFVTLSKLVRRRGNKFILLKPQPNVLKTIQASRLTEQLGVAVDDSTAEATLAGQPAS